MVKTPVHDFLKSYSAGNFTRCHTPGEKGRAFPHDITEIHGADSLYEYNSRSIIAESESIAASLFGAKKTLYSCSGSTLAIQTMLGLIKKSGGSKIAASRHVHRSFVSAAALLDLEVDWFYSPVEIKSDADAVFVTSINYLGETQDIENIVKICKSFNIPLLADNAHGAYLVFTDRHPLRLGAAMTADSAHKTLPALTGAAYLHINDLKYTEHAKGLAALFGTSSPSYLILESLDLCNAHIGQGFTPAAFEIVADLKQEIKKLGFSLKESDLLRITVNARESGFSGFELARRLRENKVECEYSDENYTVLLFSTITGEREAKAVKTAFSAIKTKKPLPPLIYPVIKPKRALSIREAVFSSGEYRDIKNSVGKICAEIFAPCPPGVPVVMPGEIIGRDEAELLGLFDVEKIMVI